MRQSQVLAYPTANTCSTTLNLPAYKTLAMTRARLLEAAESVEFDEEAIVIGSRDGDSDSDDSDDSYYSCDCF